MLLCNRTICKCKLTKSTVMQRHSNSFRLAWVFQIAQFLPPWYRLCDSSDRKVRNLAEPRCLCHTYNEQYSQGEICLMFLCSPSLTSVCSLNAIVSNWTAVRCLGKKPKQNQTKNQPQSHKTLKQLKHRPLIFGLFSCLFGQDGWARINNK